jgi:hypothetical protein
MACEYGPIALGAFSVETIFFPSDVYMEPHSRFCDLVQRRNSTFVFKKGRINIDESEQMRQWCD